MSELERKITSALRNKAGLGGLFNPMQEETDAVMGVIEARLSELEATAREEFTDDPWDHGYLRAIEDMRARRAPTTTKEP